MIEKVKAVNNPLTIIAIFAALAEIAGTIALKIVTPELQGTFVWFVMGFPALLVLLFFITLNFNPKVLYAPSDFRDEENFLTTITGVSNLSQNLAVVQQQLEGATGKIVEDLAAQIGTANQAQIEQLTEIVDNRIDSVKAQIKVTKDSAIEIADNYLNAVTTHSELKVLNLFSGGKELTSKEITLQAGITRQAALRTLHSLSNKGLVEGRSFVSEEDGTTKVLYRLRNIENTKKLVL
jgi:DNA-binding MarR family transcriptional regulator